MFVSRKLPEFAESVFPFRFQIETMTSKLVNLAFYAFCHLSKQPKKDYISGWIPMNIEN